MNFLSDIITYVRRIIKSPSNADITDELIIDYVNRFYINDVDARMQLFDLKNKYQFITTPGVDKYNMPLYSVQVEMGAQTIGMYPVYQGFLQPCFINGVPLHFETQKSVFYNIYPSFVQNLQVIAQGDGGAGPYNLQLPILPNTLPHPNNPPLQGILRGHIDITGIISTGNNIDPPVVTQTQLTNLNQTFIQDVPVTSVESAVYITSIGDDGKNIVVADSGQFLNDNVNFGLLMKPGPAPNGNLPLTNNYFNTFAITGITAGTQTVLLSTTNFSVGQIVDIGSVGGMVELNDNTYTVVAVTPTTVTLNVDSTGFTAYTTGGTISSLQNVINYQTGTIQNLYFPAGVPAGNNISVQCYFFQSGLPRAVLFNNNCLTFRNPPAFQYLVELDAYLTPAAFLNTSASVPFGYMSEYIARGAARKILSDTGDIEQFQFYEPLFREQELLVWKRSQRIWTANRTHTIYSSGGGSLNGMGGYGTFNGGTF